MRNRIIVSSVAAAAVLGLMAGCGSNSSSSGGGGSTFAGIIKKGAIKDATVTIGGVSTTTDGNGAYTIAGASAATEGTVSGGTWIVDGGTEVDMTNVTFPMDVVVYDETNASTVSSLTPVKMIAALLKNADSAISSNDAEIFAKRILGDTTLEANDDTGDMSIASQNMASAFAVAYIQASRIGQSSIFMSSIASNKANITETNATKNGSFLATALSAAAAAVTDKQSSDYNKTKQLELTIKNKVTEGNITNSAVLNPKGLAKLADTVTGADTNNTATTVVTYNKVVDINNTNSPVTKLYDIGSIISDESKAGVYVDITPVSANTNATNKNLSYRLVLTDLNITDTGGVVSGLSALSGTSGMKVTAYASNTGSTDWPIVSNSTNFNASVAATLIPTVLSELFNNNTHDFNLSNIGSGILTMASTTADSNFTTGADLNYTMSGGNYDVKVYMSVDANSTFKAPFTTGDATLEAASGQVFAGSDTDGGTTNSAYTGYRIFSGTLTK